LVPRFEFRSWGGLPTFTKLAATGWHAPIPAVRGTAVEPRVPPKRIFLGRSV